MKEYDFNYIKKYIQTNSDLIDTVDLGMKEDWFWTAETIYEKDHFTQEIDKEEFCVGGITGSLWATPVMRVEFKNGKELFLDAFTGKSDMKKPEWFSLGCLSGPVQANIDFRSTN